MHLKLLVLFLIIASVLCLNIFCTQTITPSLPLLSHYASLNDTVKYVGINSCRQCHLDIYNSFMKTGMGMSFDKASQQKTSAKFNDHALIVDTIQDFYYKPYWKNDSLHLMEFRLLGKDTIYKRDETINYIVGSGQHTNSHLINTQGYLNQAPATFYTQKGEWHLPPGFEGGNNTRFSRIIGLECMTCHNAYPKFVLGSENKYAEVKNGIDCERCHGPGEYHVLQKQAGILVDTATVIDYSIVNPSKLSVDLQFDICQRCHVQGNAVLKEGKSFLDFKPGMHLSEVMNVFMPVYKGKENEHIMASHAERLKQSKCYLGTLQKTARDETAPTLKPYQNALTCVTCHNPHVSVRVTNDSHFNAVCSRCHGKADQTFCTEKEAVRKEKNDNCVTCHMPSSGATDIPHVRVHDHKISIPLPPEQIQKIKQFAGITCINNPVVEDHTKGEAFISYFEKFNFDASVLDSALTYLSFDNPQKLRKNFEALVHLFFLKNKYEKIIELNEALTNSLGLLKNKSFSNSHAWTCYRIATAYQSRNDLNTALTYYKRAIDLAPYQLDMLNKYATALSMAGRVEDARYYLKTILSEYPKHVSALTNLGFIFLSQDHNSERAAFYYEKALALDPDYEPALLNKAGLYLYQGKQKEAIHLLKKIIKKNPQNSQAKKILLQLNTTF